jgi:hypothetical protein
VVKATPAAANELAEGSVASEMAELTLTPRRVLEHDELRLG